MNPLSRLLRKRAAATPLASSRIPDIPFSKLPRPIARKLRQAGGRIRRIVIVRGVLAVAATAIFAILCSMAVDAMIPARTHLVRWVTWLAGVGAVAVVARVSLLRPLSQKLTPARLAALIERNHPELEERLSTVVELMASPDSLADGSEELMRIVTDAAVSSVDGISPSREFTTRTIRPKLALVLVGLAIFCSLFILWPKGVFRLFLRAIDPAAEISNVYAGNLVVTPGAAVVLRGQSFTVYLTVNGGHPGNAFVTMLDEADGSETTERMARLSVDDGAGTARHQYSFTLASAEHSFSYRVECGNAITQYHPVRVVPVPDLDDTEIFLRFPAYTRSPERTLPARTKEISALEGTRVRLIATPNRPLHSALELPDREMLGPAPSGSPIEWEFSLTNGMSGTWAIRLWDDDGHTNTVPDGGVLEIVRDAEPSVRLSDPTNLVFDLPDYGTIPISYTVEDDFGLSSVSLQANLGGSEWFDVREIPCPPTPMELVWAGSSRIDLAEVSVAGRSRVKFRVRALDNLPSWDGFDGPHASFSEEIVVRLAGQNRSLGAQRLAASKTAFDRTLQDVRRSLRGALDEARAARGEAEARREESSHDRVVKASDHLARAEEVARELASLLADGPLDAVAPEARALLEQRILPAQEAAVEAAAAEGPELLPATRELVRRLEDAELAMNALEEFAREKTAELERAQRIEDLADRQRALAEQASREMTPEERRQWEERQEELRHELGQRAREMEEARDPLAQERAKAEEAARKYDELTKLQERIAALQKKLESGNEEERRQAEQELSRMTPQSPEGAKPEDRIAAAQDDVADQVRALRDQIAELERQIAERTAGMQPQQPQPQNQQQQGQQQQGQQQQGQQQQGDRQSQDGANDSDRNAEGERNPFDGELLAEMEDALRAAEGAADALRQWDGNKEEGADENARQAEGDPNAQRDWNGEPTADENARQAEGDPNAQRDWNGEPTADENARQAAGDPNAQRNWDGKVDPNAAMEQAAGEFREAAEALRNAAREMERLGQEMRRQDAEAARAAAEAMRAAREAMREQGQQQQGQMQQGQQQQGQQQQGDQQQQGQQQQGQQQQGQQQQGQQQQGQQQQGQQQQGQQQQGQQQQGQQQQGQQQQGQQQQQNPAAAQAQNAAAALQQLSDQMRQQSGQQQQGQQQQKGQQQQQQGQQQNSQQHGESQGGSHPMSEATGEEGEPGVPLPSLDADADWFKTGGGVSGEALGDGGADMPEYRDLNRSYFEAIGELERR